MKRFSILFFCVAACLAAGCAHVPDARADFFKLVDRPRVALSPQVEEMPGTNGIAEFHFSFVSDAKDRVPGILIESTNFSGRRPVVIALHGTGGNKNNMAALCRKLATNGFVAVAIDGRYHGERKSGKGQDDYNAAIVRAFHGSGEHPFYYDTVWDVMRLLRNRHHRRLQQGQVVGNSQGTRGGGPAHHRGRAVHWRGKFSLGAEQ